MINEIINNQFLKFSPNGGCIKDLPDERDYKALDLLAGVDVPIPTFQEGYSTIKKYWPDMPYKNQFNQFSCTGQSTALYKQILQAKDTGEHTELSAKSLYNPVAFPNKGAYLRDVLLRTVSYGVNKELSVPSGGTEAEVTAPFDFEPFKNEAVYFKNRIVAGLDTQNFDTIARMIYLNDGVVSGWNAHAVYFSEYGILNNKRFLKTPNSYGPNNDLYYFENMGQGGLYSIWTAVDIKNMKETGKIRLIRAKGEKTVWFLLNNRRYWVFNPEMMADGVAESVWNGFAAVEELEAKEVYSYPKTSTSLGELWKLYVSK